MIAAGNAIYLSVLSGLDSLTQNGAFRRYGPFYIFVEFCFLFLSALFWLSSFEAGSAFSPETWGYWACQFPAQYWAALMLLGGLCTSMGLIHPANKWQIVVGGAVQITVYTALSLSAALTGGQDIVSAGALIVFVPFHILVIVGAARHESE